MASFNRQTETFCPSCQSAKSNSSFIKSLNPRQNYLPFCKSCLTTKYKEYYEALKSEGGALWCLCMEVGYPMLREVYEVAHKIIFERNSSGKRPDVFMIYHNTLKELGVEVKGIWQSDLELSDFVEVNGREENEEEKNFVDYKLEALKWGNFEDTADYDYLNNLFDRYTKDLVLVDTVMELRYRDLCKAELRKRKADESGDVGEIDKTLKAIKDLMAMLKLDKFDDNKISDEEKHIERMAWLIENTDPAECEDLEKYKDISGFEKPFGDIMRCLKNLIAGSREYPEIPKDER